MLKLENPVKERSLANIVASIPDAERANVARRLARLERLIEKQNDFDEQVAAALDRILDAPRSSVRPLAKQIRKRIKEIAADVI
jgi:hypothetical protein